MASYLYTDYYLKGTSLLTLNEKSTESDFESVLGELMSSDPYLNIKSRGSHSALLISDILRHSENKSDLWFLTDTLNPDKPYRYRLIPFASYENDILAIQNLIRWSENNADKVSAIIDGGWDEEDVKSAIGGACVIKCFDNDYLNPDSLFSYLSSVAQMFRDAISNKMSIICMTYLC